MPNFNQLIYTAADYKILLLDGTTPLADVVKTTGELKHTNVEPTA